MTSHPKRRATDLADLRDLADAYPAPIRGSRFKNQFQYRRSPCLSNFTPASKTKSTN